jgi:hypothetical protein
MNPCKRTRVLLCLLIFSLSLEGQESSSYQNLYFVKKGHELRLGENDHKLSKNGFYLYRNCVYMLMFDNKLIQMAKVTDIRNDSIYYTISAERNMFRSNDTLAVHPRQLKKIKLVGDRVMGLYTGYNLRDHRYGFVMDTAAKKFIVKYDTVYSKDRSKSTTYELVPYMTHQGLDLLYEQCGVTYYYERIPPDDCIDSTEKKKPYVLKKGVWFSPTNANEIRGVNIGLQTTTLRGDSFSVKGVNLNADVFGMIMAPLGILYMAAGNSMINMPDTVDLAKMPKSVSGVSVSIGGLMSIDKIQGLILNGGICTATQSKGVVITGTQNLVDDFRGVLISGLRNRSTKGVGLQLGLLNICKHLKGVQIGLWNVNSKRKLPFINWSF